MNVNMKSITSAGIIILLLYLFLSSGCMKGSSEYDHGVNDTDKHFSSVALPLHLAGLDAAALAASRSMDNSIKTHAGDALNFHRQAHQQLDSITRFININITAATDPVIRVAYQQLLPLQGVRFDSAYLQTQVQYLQKAVNLYTVQMASGNNTSLRNQAVEKLTAIKKQLHLTDSLYAHYR